MLYNISEWPIKISQLKSLGQTWADTTIYIYDVVHIIVPLATYTMDAQVNIEPLMSINKNFYST